nr:hypothetical protein [Tanacetum cinerariifolium]
PTFNSAFRFDERLRSLETTFSEYRQTNPFFDVVSAIPGIIHQYTTQQMTEAVREAVQIQTDRLHDSLQRENDEFLCNIDENMKKIIKGQVKSQVKEQVLRILPRIEESVNATYSSRTSYAIAADLSEMELEKILIEKMEGNKSIQRLDEQRNLYKALVEAYDVDKAILDTYGESTILKLRREDDDQEGPTAGSDWGSKRRREGGEHASASTPSKTATGKEPVQTTCQMKEPSHPVFETGADDQPIVQTSQHPEWFSQPKRPPSPDRDWNETLPAAQGDAQSWISELARQTDARSSFNELLDTPIDFSSFIMNWLGVATLTPELLAGPTYELMRGSCQQYPHNLLQPLPLIPDNRGRRVIPFEHFINNDLEYLRGVRRDDDQIYKFKEGDFKRLRLQDIEDMLLLLEHCHPEARGRPSTGSGKLPEEAQPDEARHVPIRSEAT